MNWFLILLSSTDDALNLPELRVKAEMQANQRQEDDKRLHLIL